MRKWILYSTLLILATIYSFPFITKTYINYKFPDIHINQITYSKPLCLNLIGVSIQKENVSGSVNLAKVCWPNSISLFGGELYVNIKNTKSTNLPKWEIQFSNINTNVFFGKRFLSLKDASFSNGTVCAGEATYDGDNIIGYLNSICGNSKSVTAESAEIESQFGNINLHNLYTNFSSAELAEVYSLEHNAFGHNIFVSCKERCDIQAQTLGVRNKYIWEGPIALREARIEGVDPRDPMRSRINVNIGRINVAIDLGGRTISGEGACSDWLYGLPLELKNPQISEMVLKGDFSFKIQLDPVIVKISNTCKIDGAPPGFIKELRNKFTYNAYHPDGSVFERSSGPLSGEWIGLSGISHEVVTALMLTEDPGFFSHSGIIPKAIENSLRDNIKLGRFHRGGSTISMQLAKNLWLNRTKNIGRKVQEGILTIALESCLSKEQILELYLNVVEFGPDTYGIGKGSVSILGKPPLMLDIREALYLVLRLPAPNANVSMEAREKLIDRLIQAGIDSGKITEDLLDEELVH